MKKISFALLTGCILFLYSGKLLSQDKNNVAFNGFQGSVFTEHRLLSYGHNSIEEVKGNEVNIKAQRDFVKAFEKAENIRWYKLDDGFIALFSLQGTKMRANYNNKGNWVYNMATYTEEKLPREVRHLVKSTYYDYAITLVNEIKTGSKTIYIVHMADKTSWVNLRVCDGEMEVVEQLDKSE